MADYRNVTAPALD